MHTFDLNMARSHIGHKVNIHLRDGSVIINVLIKKAGRCLHSFEPDRTILHFASSIKGKASRIPLKEVEWMEPLSNYFFS